MTTITKTPFGTLPNGRDVFSYKLENAHGNYVSVINYGAAITEIVIHQNQTPTDVALGYKTLDEYRTNGCYLGACIGRVGNRIGQSRFTLNGHTYTLAANDGPNHLHGGYQGFDKQYFDITPVENGCYFACYLFALMRNKKAFKKMSIAELLQMEKKIIPEIWKFL